MTMCENNELLAHAIKDLELELALCNPVKKGCECAQCEFIPAVLVLAASIAVAMLTCE